MVTLTLLPAAPAGVLAVMLPLLTTATLLAFEPPNSTVAPLRKLEPEMVTAVPPAAGPVFGLTPVAMGPEDAPQAKMNKPKHTKHPVEWHISALTAEEIDKCKSCEKIGLLLPDYVT